MPDSEGEDIPQKAYMREWGVVVTSLTDTNNFVWIIALDCQWQLGEFLYIS